MQIKHPYSWREGLPGSTGPIRSSGPSAPGSTLSIREDDGRTARTLVRAHADAVHCAETQLLSTRVPGASLPAQWQSDRRVLQVNNPARRRAEWEMRSAARSVAIVFEVLRVVSPPSFQLLTKCPSADEVRELCRGCDEPLACCSSSY